ncbi:MAG: carboxylating nicotinate-nucleotide diphosphorylase [Hydrogenophaga sp.]|jgi:nicotinate-nucleotide pyrophosphorylase (carboxylating)|uniref:carboxylating nicotinate-nucleotide diphosphorylase n=1 Tax=Hydrogenophaga sp. TaxID=1904254 RepID=UPI000ECAA8C1|nr:carboxylating nicotinate-nucleotide diphosphorylase [Hydrogenophaga sp.]MDD3783954.1 carboxylating nicotinate-nucleotide diphosphorylase [Hydrogenophaga sp.]MDX9968083.1 carboxylating nicotinate-nucleotide diphosphorylase [Hydrogenophaga sp.]HAJ11371.1 carboxylating nicotinate-nucleotide diphosphorylase [Comamonadaceae bacterium]
MSETHAPGPLDAPPPEQVLRDVERALQEDVGTGDVTAALIPAENMAVARITCRESAVICGRPWVDEVLRQVSPASTVRWLVDDGGRCEPGQVVVEITGPARELLTAERTCLNFLQTLSGVATKTARYVEAVAGTRAAILDTRKTIPGLRVAQKYAVRCGGGRNHRMGLYDAILIKENHIAAAGGLTQAFRAAQAIGQHVAFIQVEVETLTQLQEALDAGVTMVLLDNMDVPTIRQAVDMAQGRCSLEVSGGVTLDTVPALAATGVDRISVGALIKDVKAVDFSMRFNPRPVEAARTAA